MAGSGIVVLDSITKADQRAAGAVVVAASHGGLYAAVLAARAGVRAVILSDAGIGLDRAGIAGVEHLGDHGFAAAAADAGTCRIGDGADMMARGRISVANRVAAALGVAPGQPVAEAAECLLAAVPGDPAGLDAGEARTRRRLPGGLEVVLIDSVSLLTPEDAGRVVITGSHGALLGGRPESAASVAAALLVFNDAGLGPDEVGASRLPVLEERGVAAVTVGHDTARIGDAASALATGVVSRANAAALALGLVPGSALGAVLSRLAPGDIAGPKGGWSG
jgi:hypothetical protein